MTSVFERYFDCFLHPFWMQKRLRQGRARRQELVEAGLVSAADINTRSEIPSFTEALVMSWPFIFAKAIYSFLATWIGIEAARWVVETHAICRLFVLPMTEIGPIFGVAVVLIEVALFPLSLWFFAKFWEVTIKFFCDLFNMGLTPAEAAIRSDEIVTQSLASSVFLLIPIFGSLLRFFSGPLYIYAGLKNNIGMNTSQALTVVLAPAVLFLVMLCLLFLSFAAMVMAVLG
jgi:hypothetical protein